MPDFGPAEFVSDWGATVTGARKFLIAFNVNIFGTKQQAHRIALDVRESGRGPDEVISLNTFCLLHEKLQSLEKNNK